MLKHYEITIQGRVQGVGFRYFARSKAREFQLTGFVRNSSGGDVVVVAEGDQTDLDTFTDTLRIGPTLAYVRDMQISISPFTGSYENFIISY